ncbi:MAG TPA: DUF4912 domain-containing protein [Vicinamibacteria bacterium]
MAKREAENGRTGARKGARPSSGAKARKTASKPAAPGRSPSKAKAGPKKSLAAGKGARGATPPKGRAGQKAKAPAAVAPRATRATQKTAPVAPPPARSRSGRAPTGRGPGPRPPVAAVGLSDEEQILAAKYLPRDLPPRLFEEERFLFPESYHVNRVRLLVKDPDWIFAYWDVDPKALEDIGKSLGERSMALARLSLRVSDPQNGGSTDILLPSGARWWYVRADSAARSYRAELGIILPSGEFRRLAESNRVTTPRVGPSASSARRRVALRPGTAPGVQDLPDESTTGEEPEARGPARGERALGPWTPPSVDGPPGGPEHDASRPASGGASDAFRPGGASDVYRR